MKPNDFKRILEITHKNHNKNYYKKLYKEELKTGTQDIILILILGIVFYYIFL